MDRDPLRAVRGVAEAQLVGVGSVGEALGPRGCRSRDDSSSRHVTSCARVNAAAHHDPDERLAASVARHVRVLAHEAPPVSIPGLCRPAERMTDPAVALARSPSREEGAKRQAAPPRWFDVGYPDAGRGLNRRLPLVKSFLAIPRHVVLFFITIAVDRRYYLQLVRRRLHRPLPARGFGFVRGVMRWHNRVVAYAFILGTGRYPPVPARPLSGGAITCRDRDG